MNPQQGKAPDSLAVLAVDDHAVNRDFLRAALAPRVAEIKLAGSGHEAIEAARATKFDIVVMDLHMPDMDGVAAWQRMRAEAGAQSPTRVVALTADSRPEERDRLRAAGFHGFLTKPVELQVLLTTLVRVANGQDGFAEPDEGRGGAVDLLDDELARRASGSSQGSARMRIALARELDRQAGELDRLLAEGRFTQAAELLHQWKGACGYAGARRLQQACDYLEQSLRRQLDSAPGMLYLNLLRSLESTRQAIELQPSPTDT